MKRGDFAVVALSGDYGKPRPVLVVQSDDHPEGDSITVLPLTGHLIGSSLVRIDAPIGEPTGLRKPSQIMVDKITTVPRAKVGQRIGVLNTETLADVDRALALGSRNKRNTG